MADTISRAQAESLIDPLMKRIIQEEWQVALNDELESKLTKETIAMLPPSTKIWLATWATQADKPMILLRLRNFTEHKLSLPVEALLDDLFELSEHPELHEEIARREMKATAVSLRHYIQQQSMVIEGFPSRIDCIEGRVLALEKYVEETRNDVAALKKLMSALKEAVKNTRANDVSERLASLDVIKRAVQDEIKKCQQGIQKDTTKRTHEGAFGSQDCD
ncbi:hypothetical protein TGAMA5MH_08352 [Trichoderma gamsii]|uniref:Uncharacterized protein n=1 Tax=Trichoderma gamsii TaxID=398673 RepID=A0A2K0T2D0_9HYPO|nr:hypothetical protein TGAMA5MH_08352 [Trichoderma gamsii]